MHTLSTKHIAKALIAFMLLSLSLLSFGSVATSFQQHLPSNLSSQELPLNDHQWYDAQDINEHCQNSTNSQQCNSGNAYAVISQQSSFRTPSVINTVEMPLKPYLNAKREQPFKPPK